MGRYALVKLIGRGGMADVWVGKAFGANGFEKVVAIKLLAPGNIDNEEYQRALTDEARILVHLKHPNVIDVYDLNFEAENPYLVMEYVEGVDLGDLLKALLPRNLRMPLPIVFYIISEVAKALSYTHDRRDSRTGKPLLIVHRDVSPSNILLSIEGDVKLSDFGIAKSALHSEATQTGQIKGKFRYMSPEQTEGQPLDRRSDIFSLGLVFYECLFGSPAYGDPSDVKILRMARAAWLKIPLDCDERLKTILGKLLARKRSDRCSDLRAFQNEMNEMVTTKGGIAGRDDVGVFLRRLNIPQLQRSTMIRKEVGMWKPIPVTRILTEEGLRQGGLGRKHSGGDFRSIHQREAQGIAL